MKKISPTIASIAILILAAGALYLGIKSPPANIHVPDMTEGLRPYLLGGVPMSSRSWSGVWKYDESEDRGMLGTLVIKQETEDGFSFTLDMDRNRFGNGTLAGTAKTVGKNAYATLTETNVRGDGVVESFVCEVHFFKTSELLIEVDVDDSQCEVFWSGSNPVFGGDYLREPFTEDQAVSEAYVFCDQAEFILRNSLKTLRPIVVTPLPQTEGRICGFVLTTSYDMESTFSMLYEFARNREWLSFNEAGGGTSESSDFHKHYLMAHVRESLKNWDALCKDKSSYECDFDPKDAIMETTVEVRMRAEK